MLMNSDNYAKSGGVDKTEPKKIKIWTEHTKWIFNL